MQLKNRKLANLNNFKGVDFSSSQLLVKQNRAVEAVNFIYENGVNKKRHGWIEKLRFNGRINGLFECVLNENNKKIKALIVYAGTSFYRVDFNETTNEYNNPIKISTNLIDTSRLKDQRCSMFVMNNTFYFVGCGDYLTYGKYGNNYELRRVENDEKTYIPTTTVHINNMDTKADSVSRLDDINLLNDKRKNTLVGDIENSVYQLDSEKIDANTEVIVELLQIINKEEVKKTYTNKDEDGNCGATLYLKDAEQTEENKLATIDFDKGRITFLKATFYKEVPEGETNYTDYQEENITVTFSHHNTTGDGYDYPDIINNAAIGIMYGAEGNPNRLIVAGNEKYPNIDNLSGREDLTYFGDRHNSVIGTSESKIVGYSRLGEGVLATHKEDMNGQTTIYCRRLVEEFIYDNNSQVIGEKILFPLQAGIIGETMISPYTSANLGGDKIFLSDNGVYGIVLSDNVAISERYTRERSQYIREKLALHTDLSQAVAIVYKNRYYLAVDDVCYIADARLKSENTSDTNSFNYEWWYWDNMPVRVWGLFNGELVFGTADGRVCLFGNDYTDRVYESFEQGELSIDFDENGNGTDLICVEDLDLNMGEPNIEINQDVYTTVIDNQDIYSVLDNKVYLNKRIPGVFNGMEVYADYVENTGLEVNKKYYIADIDDVENSFKLHDEEGLLVQILADSKFRLCSNLKGKELVIYFNNENINLGYKNSDERIVFVQYAGNSDGHIDSAKIIYKKNVVAVWKTPVFDFGTNQTMKTLLSITISTEPTVNGKVNFGYRTRLHDETLRAESLNVFSFDTLDFNNFSFDSSFTTSYTISRKEDFNFIQFFFSSDNEGDCIIHGLTVLYKQNSNNRGIQ